MNIFKRHMAKDFYNSTALHFFLVSFVYCYVLWKVLPFAIFYETDDGLILRSAKSNCKKNQQRIVINLQRGASCLNICRFQHCCMWDYYKVNQIKSFWCPGRKVYLWEIVNSSFELTADKIFGGYIEYYVTPVISKQTSDPHFIFHYYFFNVI